MTTFFSTHLEVAVSTCSLVGVCLSALLLLILARHRASPIIKAHSFTFTTFSLVGSLLTYLAPFTWPLDSPSPLCDVRPWAFTIPLYILLCPLLAKHYRIHRIFNIQSLQAQRWGVSDSHVLLMSLGLILPQAVINVVWTTLHPLEPISITLPTGAVIRDCHASSASAAFAWASIAYIAVLLCSAVYLTIRLRHLADEFNQSKDILSCTLLIFGAAVVIIALQVTERTDYNYRYAIRSFGLFLILLTWQFVIMLPKLWAIRRATSVAYSAEERHKGPQRLPLTPHVIKQIAAHSSIPPHLVNKQKAAAAAGGGGGTLNTGAAETMNVMFSPVASKQTKSNNYPALSTLMTFMAPTSTGSADDKTNNNEQIELVVDPVHKQLKPVATPNQLDVNMLNRISVSSNGTAHSPSGTPSPSPFQSDMQAGNHSGSELPQPSSSTSPKASQKTHLRSKSHSPFVTSVTGNNRGGRLGADGSKPSSPNSGGMSSDGRLPSLKQMRAGLIAGGNGPDSASYAQSVGTSKGTVKAARGGGKEMGGAVGSNQFKTNFEDHLSPLYTPAAITVEQVPIFMQE